MKNKINSHKNESQCNEYIVTFDSCEEHKIINSNINMCSFFSESSDHIVLFSSCELDKSVTVTTEVSPRFSSCSILDSLLNSPSSCIYDKTFYNCDYSLSNNDAKHKAKPISEHNFEHVSYCNNTLISNEDNGKNTNINSNTIIIPNDYICEIALDPSDVTTDNDFDREKLAISNRKSRNTTTNTIITPPPSNYSATKSKYKDIKTDDDILSSNPSSKLNNITRDENSNILDDILVIPNLDSNTSKSEKNNKIKNTTLILPLLSTLIDGFLKYYDNKYPNQGNEAEYDKSDKHNKHHRHSRHHKHHKHDKHRKHDKQDEHNNAPSILVALIISAILKRLK